MNWVIAIPSYNRVSILKERTLTMLESYNIDKRKIFIFVVGGQQLEYSKNLHNDYNIVIGKKGISNQRAFISEYFDEDRPIISLDDDVKNLYEINKLKKLKKITCLKCLIYETMYDMKSNKVNMCGFYPVPNPFFMKHNTSFNLKFCIGQFRIFFNKKSIETSREYILLEDYEMSLKYYLHDGRIMRYNNICMSADYNKLAGGLKETTDRSYERKIQEVEAFYIQYSDYCFIKNKRNDIDIGLKESKLAIWT